MLSSSDPTTHDVHVRYFIPTSEVPICGHATIASHYLRTKQMNLSSSTVLSKTGVGILPVDILRENDAIQIIMTQGTPEMGDILSPEHEKEALAALGVSAADRDGALPVQFSTTGHGKVIIALNNTMTLDKITPDFAALKVLTKKIGHTGYFALVIMDDDFPYKTQGRMFAPAIGINEDPVTGNANGPAGLYLSHHNVLKFNDNISYDGIQGVAMGKPGVVGVRVFKEKGTVSKVQVSGSAVEAGILLFKL